MGVWGGGGILLFSPTVWAGSGGRGGTHTGTRTGTYTRMLRLPLSDLPLKKCPTELVSNQLYNDFGLNGNHFGQDGNFGEFELPGLPRVLPGTPVLHVKIQGMPQTEKWPKTGHADDWV